MAHRRQPRQCPGRDRDRSGRRSDRWRARPSPARPRSSGAGDRGAPSTRSSSPPSNGSTGSTTAASSSRSATSRQPKPRRSTARRCKSARSPRRDPNETACGKPGAVHFPREHRARIASTAPLERASRETGRGSDVTGGVGKTAPRAVFVSCALHGDGAIVRLAGAFAIVLEAMAQDGSRPETADARTAARRPMSLETRAAHRHSRHRAPPRPPDQARTPPKIGALAPRHGTRPSRRVLPFHAKRRTWPFDIARGHHCARTRFPGPA